MNSIKVSGLPSNKYSLSRGSIRGTYMLYLNEIKAGSFSLSFSFADPSSSNSFINANSTFTLTVNPLRIYNLLPTTADYTPVCTSGNTRNIRFTAYDVFGNKVTTYKVGEDGL